ncbi:MAG: S-layer homology domain-containing protein [Candidatus Saganbacteria bacterium]|nr:S-layer homology domain-containing protein [Candidatus Saganbacteria bacterium]
MRRKLFFLLLIFTFILQTSGFAGEESFRDVPPGHWAGPSIDKLVQLKVIDAPEGLFNGNQRMTRYELAMWLDRLAEAMLLEAAVREKMLRELDAETAEMGREIKEFKTLTK